MTWKSTALSLLEQFGTLTFRRLSPLTEITVRARMRGYRADEALVGGIEETERQVIAFADDVTFSPPLRKVDKVLDQGGRQYNIEEIDDETGFVVDEGLVVYYLRVKS